MGHLGSAVPCDRDDRLFGVAHRLPGFRAAASSKPSFFVFIFYFYFFSFKFFIRFKEIAAFSSQHRVLALQQSKALGGPVIVLAVQWTYRWPSDCIGGESLKKMYQ
jgi:hypothetical protein